ncbi:MAG TPA: TIGR02266 family protein [Kofleriaceae bacterium]|nr:TIGR02266 family protein [Kofleriaceae bacterium]
MNQRHAKRTPVTLKIKFKSDTLDQFIERYSVDISHGGIFIRTKDPLPVGTSLKFEFQLKDATPLIGGEGTVVWTRDPQSAGGGSAPGMGVRFDRLPSQSQDTLEAILAHKAPAAATNGEGFSDVPTRVAPSPLTEGEGPTPLPMPFSDGEVDEEAFEASTKVASFDDLMESARKSSTNLGRPQSSPAWNDGPSPWSDDIQTSTGDSPAAPSARASGRVQIPHHDEPDDYDSGARVRRSSADIIGRGSHPDLRGHDLRGSNPSLADKVTSSPRLALVAREPDPETAVTTPAMTAAAPPVAAASEDRESRGPVIAVAAALIVAAGLGGYYILTRNQGTPVAADTVADSAGPRVADQKRPDTQPAAIADAGAAIATGNATVTIDSEPAGAMAALLGPGGKIVVSKPTPATFDDLVSGAAYKVRITEDGYVAKEIDVVAGGDEPAVAKLEALPRILRVKSSPAGASVYVNGRRVGETPADVKLTGRLAHPHEYAISVRKRGYSRALKTVAGDVALREQDGVLIHEVTLTLERTRHRPPPNNTTPNQAGDKTGDKTGDATGDKTGDKTGDATGDKTGDKAGDKTGDKAGDTGDTGDGVTEPVPDWMKSG